jgi:hypothetical protein
VVPGDTSAADREERAAADKGDIDQEEEVETAPPKALIETPHKTAEGIRTKKGTSEMPFIAPTQTPSSDIPLRDVEEQVIPSSKARTGAVVTEDRSAVVTEDGRSGPAIRTMSQMKTPEDWREQIKHWQRIIESRPDQPTLTTAHLMLAESWYGLIMLVADKDDVRAALQAHQAALECAAEDSIRGLIRDRISTLEDLLKKK